MVKIKNLEDKIYRIDKTNNLDIIISRIENQNIIDKIKCLDKVERIDEDKLQKLQNKLRLIK